MEWKDAIPTMPSPLFHSSMVMVHTTEELVEWVLSYFLDYQSIDFQTNSREKLPLENA